jgi:hypothetical protein
MDRRERRRNAIRTALAMGAEPAASHGLALRLWGRLQRQLAPVIGHQGVDALVDRSLQLTGINPARLYVPDAPERQRTSLEALLETTPEANAVLLETFTDLLATLIGASLTDRLLDPVWAEPKAETEPAHDR